MFNARALTVTVLVGLAAFANAQEPVSNRIEVQLRPTVHNAGKGGWAVFHRSGDRTLVFVTFSGLPHDVTSPLRLNPYLVQGSCENRGNAAALALGDRGPLQSLINPEAMAVYRGPARASYDLSRPFDSLAASPFALSVRLDAADGGREIFCGDISS